MPNLRKRSSVLTYNDDAIYRAIENQRKLARNGTVKISKSRSMVLEESKFIQQGEDRIPEFVYASDGRKFFPCLFCCHAFAVKELQMVHMKQCAFRVQEISGPPVVKTVSSKVQRVTKPKITHSTKAINQPKKLVKSQFKTNPKLLVQKTKHFGLQVPMGNGAIKMIKQQPKKSSFPKVKIEPGAGKAAHQKTNGIANLHSQIINRNKFTKNMYLQPRLGGQTNNLLKHPRKKLGNTCPDCNIVFESTASLVRHKREVHTFPKIYVSADKLKEYDEMYKNSDMSKCTLCGKPVPKVRWSRHLRTHVNEKKHFCRVCKKSFGRRDHLNVHERTHFIDVIDSFVKS